MPNQCIGKEVNTVLLKKLNEELEKFVTKNKVSEDAIKDSNQVFKTIFKDSDGKDIYLLTDEPGKAPEKYELLSDLINYISFEKTSSDEVYGIPEIIVRDSENKDHKEIHNIYITKNNAKLIAQNERKFRTILGIEFPDELFQIYHENIIPGIDDYTAPLPRKYSETEEEYERRLEEEYKAHGVEREKLGEYRKPYPHEMVRYNNPIPEMTEIGRPSYLTRLTESALSREGAEPGGPGSHEGERRTVIDTNPTLGQKLNNFLQSAKGVSVSKDTAKRVLGTAAAGVLIGGSLFSAPIATLAVVGSAGAFLGIGYVGKKYGTKAIRAIKKKWNDWLRGPVIEEPSEPEHTTTPESTPTTEPTRRGPTRGDSSSRNPGQPESEQSEIPDDLSYVLAEISADSKDINNIDAKIEVIKEALKTADESAKAALEQELTKLQTQKRQYLVNVYNLLQQYINNKTVTIGGPRL